MKITHKRTSWYFFNITFESRIVLQNSGISPSFSNKEFDFSPLYLLKSSIWYIEAEVKRYMNSKAAIFASLFTGGLGILASLFFLLHYGLKGFIAGLIGSAIWFGLAYYLKKTSL
ncbi:hypothetical protein DL897_16205 [Thermoflavimicrobium daqui]|jgi:hypothetical protein|uniref:Uncharacterized protein n=2 Tax=Thermoflavimicrobium daqui TaxID=2137476 RepID=A0A364K1D7_9BACL|nr:hypothetical protein DL897_16205 [Thermoflavimicrobium daqui]